MPGLEGAVAVLDPPARQHEENPGNHAFYHDLFAMFGEASDPGQFAAGPQNTHRHLTELLAAHPSLRERSADLVVVAHALPDSQPYGVTASHAGLLFGDDSHGFAVSEQGLAAPFTALRILSGFWCSGRTRRPVLLVLEQTTLPVRDPAVHGEHPLVDSGALLAFGGEGSLRLRGATDIHLEVAREELTVRLNAVVDQDPEGTLVVLGPSAAERPTAAIARRELFCARMSDAPTANPGVSRMMHPPTSTSLTSKVSWRALIVSQPGTSPPESTSNRRSRELLPVS